MTHQFDLPSGQGDLSLAICPSGGSVHSGGSSIDNSNTATMLTTSAPYSGYIGWQTVVFNTDATDHVIHTWALCGPAITTTPITEAPVARPRADTLMPLAAHR